MSQNDESTTNVVGYVGRRFSNKELKRFLARAKNTPNQPKGYRVGESHGEAAAIKSLVLGAPLKYIPKPAFKVRSLEDTIADAIANRESVALASGG